ncbi:MAG: PDDEXK nuclease domain-containing protein [Candidatus Sumerlaeota bacterium]|nr:PDDEXK nuclease domain-containing protein [Candidatus Sumerlaeota bacterium]
MSNALEPSFAEIIDLIRSARQKALQAVNTVLIDLYWQVGEYISRKVVSEGWGNAVILQLAGYLHETQPGLRGFSAPNLWRMKQFYETYHQDQKLSSLLRQLSWSANLHLLSKCKAMQEREFYLQAAINERWSVRDLEKQIDSCLYERMTLSPAKLSTALRVLHPSANQIFKDTYVVGFLNLSELHSESDLQKGLVIELKKFFLELGKDFCFVGEQYPLQVGSKDFFIDLLFFHRTLSCLVAFELKTDDFKPEYLGKLSFYLEALDRDVRKPHENPSVGVLLCKSKDNEVVEYALSRTLSPALVAEYQTRLPDKALLQQKMHEFYELENQRESQCPS